MTYFDKNTHYIIVQEYNGKFCAHIRTIYNNNNLVSLLNIPNVHSVNAADTKKAAEELARQWNNDWRKQGNLWEGL